MEWLMIIWRTLFIYFFLLLSLRMMGKRELGELTILDFIVAIMIAELAVIAIDAEVSLAKSVLPIILLTIIQILLSILALKSSRARTLFEGKPAMIIEAGNIDEVEMRKQRYNYDDLLFQLRQQGMSDLTNVEYAVLEATGELSVIEKKEEGGEAVYPFPLVIDSEIQQEHLKRAGKTEFWLREQLTKEGFTDLQEVALCCMRKNGTFIIDEK